MSTHNLYAYEVDYMDNTSVHVEAGEFRITKTDVTFFGDGEDENTIVYWTPITNVRYVRLEEEE